MRARKIAALCVPVPEDGLYFYNWILQHFVLYCRISKLAKCICIYMMPLAVNRSHCLVYHTQTHMIVVGTIYMITVASYKTLLYDASSQKYNVIVLCPKMNDVLIQYCLYTLVNGANKYWICMYGVGLHRKG